MNAKDVPTEKFLVILQHALANATTSAKCTEFHYLIFLILASAKEDVKNALMGEDHAISQNAHVTVQYHVLQESLLYQTLAVVQVIV